MLGKSLKAAGVADENIVLQSVPGSYELPYAVQKVHAASTIESSTSGAFSAADLLSSISATDLTTTASQADKKKGLSTPFDAIIAIGVLIKGETMHFEYISDAVSHGLMKVQLEHWCTGHLWLIDRLERRASQGQGGSRWQGPLSR